VRVLALDIGERRVGVAISDPAGCIASPLLVLDASARLDERLEEIIDEYEVGLVVVGLPLTLAGDEGPQAGRVREVGERIAARVTVPIVYHDERLSSAEANRAMKENTTSRTRRGSVDKIAAAIFLQSFLDGGTARVTEESSEAANGS
jgi:putative holliday junction resolvase